MPARSLAASSGESCMPKSASPRFGSSHLITAAKNSRSVFARLATSRRLTMFCWLSMSLSFSRKYSFRRDPILHAREQVCAGAIAPRECVLAETVVDVGQLGVRHRPAELLLCRDVLLLERCRLRRLAGCGFQAGEEPEDVRIDDRQRGADIEQPAGLGQLT